MIPSFIKMNHSLKQIGLQNFFLKIKNTYSSKESENNECKSHPDL